MKIKKLIIPFIILLALIALDQGIKIFVSSNMDINESIPVIKDIFEFMYIHNEGAAWGMLSGRLGFLVTITIIVILGCFYVFNNLVSLCETKYKVLRWSIIFLIAGSIGNMIDRIRLGYVVDYLYFKLIDFPIFNLADIFVVCSIIVIFFLILFKLDNDDIDLLIGKKPKDE